MEGSELAEEVTAGESRLGSVLGLMGEGDAKSLWPVTSSPAADFRARVEASADMIDRKEGFMLSNGVNGKSG